jgi:hypothetical protein
MTSAEPFVIESRWRRTPEEAEAGLLDGSLRPNRRLLENRDFFKSKSLAELAKEQGVGPIKDIRVLAGGIPDDEDLDKLIAQLEEWRS